MTSTFLRFSSNLPTYLVRSFLKPYYAWISLFSNIPSNPKSRRPLWMFFYKFRLFFTESHWSLPNRIKNRKIFKKHCKIFEVNGVMNTTKNIFFLSSKLIIICLSFQMYVCEECGHTTSEPEVHYLHLKELHPYSPALLKFYDKRHFKFTNATFANNLLSVNPMTVHN